MKINQNVTFLKTAADNPALAPAKEGLSASRLAAETPAVATQTRAASTAALLPSTHGDFDAARVAEIRDKISAGRYQVDTGKIADGLLATVRDLLNKPAP